jgi:ADP-ribosylglycohydrolase
MSSLKEKVSGAVFGAAIGDALGTLVEEMDREQVKKAYGGPILTFREPSPLSVCPHLKKGQYSHETQIFLMALRVYAEKGYFDENYYLELLTQWVKDQSSHRYPAGSHLNAALSYAAGLEPEEARVKAADIDGAIPAFAAGLYRWDSGDEAYREGVYVASLTHDDETLIDTAGLLAFAASEVVGGRVSFETEEDRLSFVDYLREHARSENLKGYLDLLLQVLKKSALPVDEVVLLLGNGSFAPEAFTLALYFALTNSRSYYRGVIAAVNSYSDFGGDTDAVAFITGGLLGGYLGVGAIPKEWLQCLENRREIELLLDKFLEKLQT